VHGRFLVTKILTGFAVHGGFLVTKSVSVFAVHGGFSTTENSLRGSRGGSRGNSRDGSRPVFRRALRILGDGEFSAGLEGMLEGKLQGWLEAGFSPCTEDSRRRRILCGALGDARGEAPGMARGWFFAVHGGFSTTENSLRGSRGGSRGSSRDGSRLVFTMH
jgi:hypothetical protein